VPVFSFHGISILMASTALVDYLAPASYVLAVAAGIGVVALTGHCNVPVLFTIGFMQPILIYLPVLTTLPLAVLRDLPIGLPFLIGVACASGGWLTALRYGRPTMAAFSVAEWREWIAPAWNVLRGWEKFETVFKAVGVLAAVLAWVYALF
jgi:hypothetical protein